MATFAENTWFHTMACGKCGVPFALSNDFRDERIKDQKTFYCPNGCARAYNGPSEADKLRQELERKAQMLDAAQIRAGVAEVERQQIAKAHQKMRARVMNGVCPCCNRTFQNLMNHMRSEHPDFDSTKTLSVVRQAFGMTQSAVAREAGVNASHVSVYERGGAVASYAKVRLDDWLVRHQATAAG